MRKPVDTFVGFLCCAAVLSGQPSVLQPEKVVVDRRVSLNEGWRFFKGDAQGAEQSAFADEDWRVLDLPHDWAIEGPFDRKYGAHQGALPYAGVGWYRKTFKVAAAGLGRRISIEFD